MSSPHRLALLALALLVAALPADDTDPEPPGGTLKALKQPEDKARDPDVIFVPTPQPIVDKILAAANITKKDVLFSLGCGDGRYVVTSVKKYGCRAVGFDIDPQRVKETKENIEKNKVEKRAFVRQRDIFTVDLSEATVVTMYLLPNLNVKLIPQLKKLKPGSRIFSHDFDIRGVKPDAGYPIRVATENGRTHLVYRYTTPLKFEK